MQEKENARPAIPKFSDTSQVMEREKKTPKRKKRKVEVVLRRSRECPSKMKKQRALQEKLKLDIPPKIPAQILAAHQRRALALNPEDQKLQRKDVFLANEYTNLQKKKKLKLLVLANPSCQSSSSLSLHSSPCFRVHSCPHFPLC